MKFVPGPGFQVLGTPMAPDLHPDSITPKARAWREAISDAAAPFIGAAPIDAPIKVTLIFFFDRPASLNKPGVAKGPIPFATGPRIADLADSFMAACVGIGLWANPAQVFAMQGMKFYTGKGDISGTRCTIEVLVPGEEGGETTLKTGSSSK